MYYHSRELKYTTYDKVFPAPLTSVDPDFLKPYQWLGKYCGYCPQIWLGRSKSAITGYKSKTKQKSTKFRGDRKNIEPYVMFSFDIIKGFPVDFDVWCSLLNKLMGCKNPVKEGDDAIKKFFDEWVNDCTYNPRENGSIDELKPDDILYKWIHSGNYENFLSKCLFVENDQVVVPSLNLKSAKEIFCRNEKQVKVLRHMGFIQDRIKILNSKQWD